MVKPYYFKLNILYFYVYTISHTNNETQTMNMLPTTWALSGPVAFSLFCSHTLHLVIGKAFLAMAPKAQAVTEKNR